MNRVINITYRFTLELMILLLLFFFYYININLLPPLMIITIFAIGSIILYILLVNKFLNKGIWLYLLLISPVLYLVSNLLPVSLFTMIVVELFVLWRGMVLYADPSSNSEILLLLLSLLIGVVVLIYAAMSHYSYLVYIITLLIVQLLFILIGGFLRKWYSIGNDRNKFAIYFSKILISLLLIGLFLSLSIQYFRVILLSILQGLVYVFSFLSVPFEKFILFLINLFGAEEFIPKPFESDVTPNKDDLRPSNHDDYLIYILIGICVILLIMYFHKKWKGQLQAQIHSSTTVVEESEQLFHPKQSGFFRGKVKGPQDPVRKEIFELQKFAKRLHLNRLPHESLNEWWERIGVFGSFRTPDIYKKVRYGELSVTEEEHMEVKEEIRAIKKQLTERRKKEAES